LGERPTRRPVENGVTACGLDLTDFVNFGGAGQCHRREGGQQQQLPGGGDRRRFEWMGRAFNPNYGGLNHDIWLHLAGKVYQTLPLYENLKTTGIYIYPSNFSISEQTCDVNVEAQVRNESATRNPSRSRPSSWMRRKVCARNSGRRLGSGQRRNGNAHGRRQIDGGKILER
jgi:hypothetical protein